MKQKIEFPKEPTNTKERTKHNTCKQHFNALPPPPLFFYIFFIFFFLFFFFFFFFWFYKFIIIIIIIIIIYFFFIRRFNKDIEEAALDDLQDVLQRNKNLATKAEQDAKQAGSKTSAAWVAQIGPAVDNNEYKKRKQWRK